MQELVSALRFDWCAARQQLRQKLSKSLNLYYQCTRYATGRSSQLDQPCPLASKLLSSTPRTYDDHLVEKSSSVCQLRCADRNLAVRFASAPAAPALPAPI
jgi:hypothetical protein